MAGFYNPYGFNPYGVGGYPPPSVVPQMGAQIQQGQQLSLIRVTGIDGARAYQMPPNSVAALFDGGEDIFYIKSTDSGGFGTVNAYRFEKVEDRPTQVQESDFVTRKEFEELKGMIEDGKQSVWRSKQPAEDQ